MRMVFICGVPSSGNRVLKELLRQPGVCRGQIKHWGEGGLRGDIAASAARGEDPRVLLLVRDTECLKASMADRYPKWESGDHDRWKSLDMVIATHWQQTLRVCAEAGVPIRVVTYESLVEGPEAFMEGLTEWLGVPYVGLNVEVTDENEKRRPHAAL